MPVYPLQRLSSSRRQDGTHEGHEQRNADDRKPEGRPAEDREGSDQGEFCGSIMKADEIRSEF